MAAYLAGAVAVAVGLLAADGDLGKERVSQWSNLFFLLPAVRALFFVGDDTPPATLYPGAWAEGIVFFVTFLASTAHHGCFANQGFREALAAESVFILWIGVLVFFWAAYTVAITWVTGAPDSFVRLRSIDKKWSSETGASLSLAAILAVLVLLAGFLTSMVFASQQRLDGCFWVHGGPGDAEYASTQAPALASVWDTVDFVTAFSALVVSVLFLFHVQHSVAFGLFWVMAIVILAGKLGQTSGAGLLSQGGIIAVAAVFGACIAVCQCVVWCTYPPSVRRSFCAEYNWANFAITALAGVSAILLFTLENTPTTHSIWHALGALALYSAVESRYQKVSARDYKRRQNVEII